MNEQLEILRHSCAHLLAQSLKEIYQNDIQITIGPVIEDGFYYDIFTPENKRISVDDLERIEEKMQEIANQNHEIVRQIWSREKAIKFFKDIGEFYKVKIIEDISKDEELSLYQQGDFIDLCRGPHLANTNLIKNFKLLKISGAYWRGDSKNEMLQRIYGTAWQTKEDLEKYLKRIEEAEKRDHRKLGKVLHLFHQQEEAPGDVFWHKKGTILYNIIENYIRRKFKKYNYQEVKTPQMVSKKLWEMSGHWEKYKQNMFISRIEEEDSDFAIKPMNCPCHVQIFNNQTRSYKELPIRFAEFGRCHRYEPSGSLHGLMRVRAMTQDDAHIFCTEEQIVNEVESFYLMLKEIYQDFGFNEINIKLSDRPQIRAGTNEIWDKAENGLKDAMAKLNVEYSINKGEGAFYGPKLEFCLKDAIGREWQCGTLQLDFVLPERLGAEYISEFGEKKYPVILHRAVLGSMERFIGILIENYAGALPVWLAPTQIVILGVNNDFDKNIHEIVRKFGENEIRTEGDYSSDTVSYKIRKHSEQKIPYVITIGKREIESEILSVRKFGENNSINMKFEEIIKEILAENK